MITFVALKNHTMNFPEDLKYSKDHEWLRLEGDSATAGITEFAQGELGDIVFIDIPSNGKSLAKEAVFGTVEAVKTVSDLFMPVSGTVTEINGKLDKNPELLNKSPYGDGWLIKIKVSNAAEANDLMNADAYKKLIGVQ